MSASDQLMSAISRIQDKGWTTASLKNDEGYCLVGACNDEGLGETVYRNTPAIEALSKKILEECEYCSMINHAYGFTRDNDHTGLVWRHNDRCLTSGEDAILLMKRTAHEI